MLLIPDAEPLHAVLARHGVSLDPADRVLLAGAPVPLDQPLREIRQQHGPSPVAPERTATHRGGPRQAPRRATGAGTGAQPLHLVLVRALPIDVVDGDTLVPLRTTAPTVGSALADAGVTLRPGDRVVPPLEAPTAPGLRVVVTRPRELLLICDGQERVLRMHAGKVADLLTQAGIEVGRLDRVEPPLDADVQGYTRVRVVRVTETIETVREQAPFGEAWQPDPQLLAGQTREVSPGRPGTVRLTVKRRFDDGAEVESTVLEQQVLEPPRDRVLAFGTRIPKPTPVPPSRAPGVDPRAPLDMDRVRTVMPMVATAYDAGRRSTGKSPGDPGYGITKSGMRAAYGVVAVDPRVIPLGTKLYIPGYGHAVAGDTGGAIVGMRIDLFFEAEAEALRFGRRVVEVYVLD
jgi:3D (Asp-Asp-Asp) domain-containing protein